MKITETVTREATEKDQFFMVGRYNVNFYLQPCVNCTTGDEYYLLILEKFTRLDKLCAKKTIYVKKKDDDSYGNVWNALHSEEVLDQLMEGAKDAGVCWWNETASKVDWRR